MQSLMNATVTQNICSENRGNAQVIPDSCIQMKKHISAHMYMLAVTTIVTAVAKVFNNTLDWFKVQVNQIK